MTLALLRISSFNEREETLQGKMDRDQEQYKQLQRVQLDNKLAHQIVKALRWEVSDSQEQQ